MITSLVQGGALAILAWVVYWTGSRVLPEQNKTQQKISDTFANEAREQRKMFQDECKSQRETFAGTLKEIEVGFVDNVNKMFLQHLNEQRADFRDELSKQRHSFMNLINAPMMRVQIENKKSAEDVSGTSEKRS